MCRWGHPGKGTEVHMDTSYLASSSFGPRGYSSGDTNRRSCEKGRCRTLGDIPCVAVMRGVAQDSKGRKENEESLPVGAIPSVAGPVQFQPTAPHGCHSHWLEGYWPPSALSTGTVRTPTRGLAGPTEPRTHRSCGFLPQGVPQEGPAL